jgi:anti-anti-sigma factor
MTMPEPFSVTPEQHGEGLLLRFRGEFDMAAADDAAAALQWACARGGRIEVDLGEVTFMDSSGLRTLVTARRAADRDGCSLVLVSASERVAEVLDITGTHAWLRDGHHPSS